MGPGRKNLKFGIGLGVILMTIAWLAYSGIQESKTYYITVKELQAKPDATLRRYRVGGSVTGTVKREAGRVEFHLEEDGKEVLPVVYSGKDPAPDTLQAGALAMADGRYQTDGTFQAETVQAKCASKYEPAAMKAAVKAGATKMPATN